MAVQVGLLAGAFLAAGCNGAADEGTVEMKLMVPTLVAGKDIPARFTCDGEDLSPLVQWSDPPAGTRSFALILDDPDAPGGVFTHWGAFDIGPDARKIGEGAGNSANAPFRQARNDFGAQGYRDHVRRAVTGPIAIASICTHWTSPLSLPAMPRRFPISSRQWPGTYWARRM